MDPVESRGVCWARSIACSLYQGENFFFQIDSHMLFEPAWDEQLLQLWQDLKKFTHKPIISTYPYGFEFEEGKAVVKISVSDKTTLVLRPKPESSLSQANATLSFRAEHVFVRQPVLGSHVAGGFLFTHGDFIDEIPYDPRLYVHGEEQSIALRAFTHGWDIYHTTDIPIYHLYSTGEVETSHREVHWSPNADKERNQRWWELDNKSKARMTALLQHNADLGIYGLGKARTLTEYANFSGIDYRTKTIAPHAKRKGTP
jgi:hypothetical protein